MEKSDFRETILTNRGLFEYLEDLEIPEADFNNPNALILDLGAGIQQRLAKEAGALHLKSKIISVDPRLGLREEEDLALPSTERDMRVVGRKNPAPRSLAATAEALPFRDGTFERIYALYSVPYYLSHPEEIEATIYEVLRVLRPEGVFRAYPILEEQVDLIRGILGKRTDIAFDIKEKEEDFLLVLTKR